MRTANLEVRRHRQKFAATGGSSPPQGEVWTAQGEVWTPQGESSQAVGKLCMEERCPMDESGVVGKANLEVRRHGRTFAATAEVRCHEGKFAATRGSLLSWGVCCCGSGPSGGRGGALPGRAGDGPVSDG